jgi:hypothetical protein
MTQLTFTPEEYGAAVDNLRKYYGIDLTNPTEKHIRGTASFDAKQLAASYSTLVCSYPNGKLCQKVLDTLLLLTAYVIDHTPTINEESFKKVLQKYTRQDLLRLYVFCYEYLDGENRAFTLRGSKGSVRMENYCNWFRDEMVRDYLEKNLPGITSVAQAKAELLSGKRKRGRVPNDARVPALLWGTYQLLTERQGLPDTMPNALCEFLIQMLQIQLVFPLDTEIDAFWIRAQLRYIRSRDKKPRFPKID